MNTKGAKVTKGTNGAKGAKGTRARKRTVKLVGVTILAVAVLFAIGYLFAVRVLFPPLPEPQNGIVVPALTGLTVPAAEAKLRQLDLRVTDVVEIAHPTQPKGIIVAQSPLPGQQLRTAGAVRLGISAGPPSAAVPNVVGFTLERAVAALTSVGFQVVQISEPSDQPAETVVRTEPAAGRELATPARVVVYISSGPPPVTPDTTPAPADTLAVSASGTTT